MPLVSVIVPVYNVEKYLKRCLDSIINQSLKDIELILVDDGSTDLSGEICDEYALIDERIKVIHKENGRVASARNRGLKISKGKYINFIDSDDWIENEMYKEMILKAEEFNCEIVMCDTTKRTKDNSYIISQVIEEGYYNREKIEKDLFNSLIMFENIEFPITISNCVCLFKREFIIKNNLFYDEDIHYCEDSIFGSKSMFKANNFYYMKGKCFYNYFLNEDSTTNKYNIKKWEAFLKINERIEQEFSRVELDFSRQIKINMLYFTLNILQEIGKSKESFFKKEKLCKEVMRNSRVKSIFKDFKIPEVNLKNKIVINIIKNKCAFIYSFVFYFLKGEGKC